MKPVSNDPWNLNDAYGKMFCNRVWIKGRRPRGEIAEGCFAACVYPSEREQPFADFDADSTVRRLSFLLPKDGVGGWSLKAPPQIGDEVTLAEGSRWKVCSVVNTVDWYEMEARSC